MPHVQIASNAVVAVIQNPTSEIKAILTDLLSYEVDGHEFSIAFQQKHWSGRSSLFENRRASFPAGFLHMVQSELSRRGYTVHLTRFPLPAPLGPENPIVDEFGNDDPRYDYQLKTLDLVLRHGRGIVQIATGGGKSKVAKLITARIRRPTLFITTRGVLMYQMKEGYESAGLKCGVVGDTIWAPIRGTNVGMVQTLAEKLKEPVLDEEMNAIVAAQAKQSVTAQKKGLPFKPMSDEEIVARAKERVKKRLIERARTIKLLELIEVVIGEEAHEASGNSFYEIMRHCRNAHYRIALTATPFMKDNAESNMRLMAAFGPILIKISEKELIDRGILARPIFKFVASQPHEKLRKSSPWPRCLELGYVQNAFHHRDVVRDALMAKRYGLPVLTLVMRKEHGRIIAEKMRKIGLVVEFIQGVDDQAERKAALKRLELGEIDVLIGTTILDVGVDMPVVGLVQLAGGGKAEVQLRQRIGRGLRAKKRGPNVVFVVDYSVAINATLRDHTRTRRLIVESTPGFAENILPEGKDFPWAMFDLAKAA